MTETIDTAQPEALRLAQGLADGHCSLLGWMWPAAAELRRLHSALAAAEARNATLMDDAARYRYLRNDVLVDGEICEDLYVAVDQPAYPNSWALTGAELDQAVDAARAFLSGATKESNHGTV